NTPESATSIDESKGGQHIFEIFNSRAKEEAQELIESGEEPYIEDETFPLWLEEHYVKVFQWNYMSSIVMFFLVFIVVCSGIVLSYWQFYSSLSRSGAIAIDSSEDRNSNDDVEHLKKSISDEYRYELEISKAGIKISSSVVGLVTLTISLAFLYLYLAYVHPINILNLQKEVINRDMDQEQNSLPEE
ncbi:MAG: hypothetical protein AAFY57_03985, partial [Cyanobacteria bacterium J06642_2]